MYDPDGTTRYTMMNGGWMTGFAVLTIVLLVIAVLAVLANLFFHVSTKAGPGRRAMTPSASEARSVLDGRLARGEVAPEEYRTLRQLLDS